MSLHKHRKIRALHVSKFSTSLAVASSPRDSFQEVVVQGPIMNQQKRIELLNERSTIWAKIQNQNEHMNGQLGQIELCAELWNQDL